MKPVTPGTKTAKVLAYLKTGHSLDIPKATALWGHIRLSDVIFRLRAKGYPITTEVVKNGPVEFAIYRLPKLPSRDTKKGTRVKVLPNAECHKDYHGKVGFLRCHTIPGTPEAGFDCLVHVAGTQGTVAFHYNELEII